MNIYTLTFREPKQHDTREALYPHELNDDVKAELERGYLGERNPELDPLMD